MPTVGGKLLQVVCQNAVCNVQKPKLLIPNLSCANS